MCSFTPHFTHVGLALDLELMPGSRSSRVAEGSSADNFNLKQIKYNFRLYLDDDIWMTQTMVERLELHCVTLQPVNQGKGDSIMDRFKPIRLNQKATLMHLPYISNVARMTSLVRDLTDEDWNQISLGLCNWIWWHVLVSHRHWSCSLICCQQFTLFWNDKRPVQISLTNSAELYDLDLIHLLLFSWQCMSPFGTGQWHAHLYSQQEKQNTKSFRIT